MTFENMVIDSIAGQGMWVTSTVEYYGTMKDSIYNQYDCGIYPCIDTIFAIPTDTTRIINCDIFDCVDSLSWNAYNYADGIKGDLAKGGVMYLSGVRVWNTCDDGIDLSGTGQKILNNCWVFYIGSTIPLESKNEIDDGNGYKLGGVRDSIEISNWEMSNCISAGNFRYAIHILDYAPYYRDNARVYNSVFYKNGNGPASMYDVFKPWQDIQFYNSITYMNTEQEVAIFGNPYPIFNCSWIYSESSAHPYDPNPLVTVTDYDFVSLDINELSKPRNADGSLPNVNFMKLASNSDLIDKGIDVGLSFIGSAPDIGAFEFGLTTGIKINRGLSEESLYMQNYPNPFNSSTTITYQLVTTNHVRLNVVDMSGREVASLVDEVQQPGYQSVKFDAGNLESGIYFYNITAGKLKETRKLMLSK